MNPADPVYSVLIVSSSRRFVEVISGFLPQANYQITTVLDVASARRKLAERTYDFVIINAPLAEDSALSIDIGHSKETVALMFTSADLHEETTQLVYRHGVYTLPRPASRNLVETALDWMAATRERLRRTQKKTLSIEEKMQEIRLVNKAKWLLIEKHGFSEQEAHRYLEKQAMDRSLSRRTIAEEVIARLS